MFGVKYEKIGIGMVLTFGFKDVRHAIFSSTIHIDFRSILKFFEVI